MGIRMNPKRILSLAVFFVFSVTTTGFPAVTESTFTSSVIRNDEGVSVSVLTPNIEFADEILEGMSFQKIMLKSDAIIGQVGGPGLPAVTQLLELPAGREPSLTYEFIGAETFQRVKLAPIPRSASDNSKIHKNLIRQELFEENTLQPAEVASLTPPFNIGGSRYTVLTLAPFQYNPFTQTLVRYSEIRASIRYVPSESPENNHKFDEPVWRELAAALNDAPPRDDISPRTDNLGHLVIVVPNDNAYENAIAPLVNWKKRMGYVVTVVRMVRDVEYHENALKGYLETAWNEWELPPTYIILVGESARIPFFRDNDGEGSSWYISDNQYVTYGYNEGQEIEGWIPRSFIGRLPAQTAAEAVQMVTKIVGYESDPFNQQAWVEGGVMIAAGVHSCIQTNQAVRERMIEYGYRADQVAEAYAEYHAGQPNVDPNIVTNAVNGGLGFVNFRGYDTWGGYTTGQIRALRNSWRLPIVTGMVCATNDYANRFGAESIGEAWVRAYNNNEPAGAVACFGPSDRHTHTWFNNTLDGEFYRLLLNRGVHTLGALDLGSKLSLLRNYPSLLNLGNGESVGYYFFTYGMFGDPSMQVRTREPMEMEATYESSLPVGSTNLIVSVTDTDGNPLPDAYVHYYIDDDNRFGARTDANGEAIIEVAPLEESTLKLTITAVNYIPLLDEIEVSTQSAMASLLSFSIDDDNVEDSQGNSDGIVNPGEWIELTVTLANRGSETLQNLRASLESRNAFATVTRQSAGYGNVEPDGDAESDVPYLIEIAPETPSETKLEFLLSINSDEDFFPVSFGIPVEGYNFTVTGIETTDRQPLTPGATRGLVITIENSGRLNSDNLLGTLYCVDRTIQLRGAEANFSAIEPGDTCSNSEQPFDLTAGFNASQGGTVKFGLLLVDEAGLRDSLTFDLKLGDPAIDSPQGPDDYGYWAIDSRDTATGLEPEFERLQGNSNLNLVDNNDAASPTGAGGAVRTIDLPFPFVFYGERYRRLTVSTNGFIAFGESISIGWNNQELGSGLTGVAMVAPYWDDLYSGSVWTRFDEDNSRFIIEWRNFAAAGAQSLNFAVVLYDPATVITATGDGEIVIHYTEIPQMRDIPNEAVTIGIASPDGATALTVRHAHTSDMRTGLLHSGMAVRFTTGIIQDYGTLIGSVTDAGTGEPMSGVRIKLEGTGFYAITDDAGQYQLDNAVVGSYNVLARKRYFNEISENNVEIRLDEITNVDFSLTHPEFRIDIETIQVTVPPDSIRYRNFNVSNDGNGPLEYEITLNVNPEGAQGDTAWSLVFDWNASEITDETNLRGVTADKEFFYLAGQRVRSEYPHPMFVLNMQGELQREFDQFPIDSAARGYACLDFNGTNIVAVEERSIVELSTEGEFIGSIVTPERQASLSIAYAPITGTYFTKGITGSNIFEIDAQGNLVTSHPTADQSFRTFGFAWFPTDPDGYCLYTLRLNQEEGVTEVWKMNHQNSEWLKVRTMNWEVGDLPIDMVITKRYDPLKWILAVLVNRQAGDRLMGYQLSANTTWIDFEPSEGIVEAGRTQEFHLEFAAEDLPRDQYDVVLELVHNAAGDRIDIPVTFIVGDEISVNEPLLLPIGSGLQSLYPNPFNSKINASFSLPHAGVVSLALFDAAGREVRNLELGRMETGSHTVTFEGHGLVSGVYLLKLETGHESFAGKVVLIK